MVKRCHHYRAVATAATHSSKNIIVQLATILVRSEHPALELIRVVFHNGKVFAGGVPLTA
jgi:hypothetical protein